MQMMVPSYLEFSLEKLAAEQGAFRDQCVEAFGMTPLANAARPVFGPIEEQARKNMAMFREALSMFPPFPPGGLVPAAPSAPTAAHAEPDPAATASRAPGELDALKQQLDALHRRLDSMSKA